MHATISLRGSSDHVLDEVPVSRGINDGDIVLGGLELPESNVDGDSSLTLGLQFVKNPCVLKRSLSRFLRAMSMVIPLSRSAFSLSRTHAYLKDPFPDS